MCLKKKKTIKSSSRERERERVKVRRFKYFLFTAFVISAIFAYSPSLVSAYGESSPTRSLLASIGSFFKGLVFSSGNQAGDQNENDSNVITYDKAEFEKQLQQQKQDIKEALTAAKRAEAKYNSSGLKIEGRTTENKTVEKTIEKIVSGLSQSDLDSGLSNLRTELQNLNTSLLNQINNLSVQSDRQTSAVYQAVSLTNKIDSLSGTRLTNITVSGVSGLTDADIPDGITASNYLLLSGGTMTGNLLLPASAYLNFGTDSGSSGYGVRDNGGTMQFKNSSGSWTTISPAYWSNNGSSIYYNDGNIGIGTTSPSWKLSVAGIGSFDDNVRASYFTATSTTASTFPYLNATTAFQLGSDYITDITGTNLSITNGVLSATGGGASPDWKKETNYGALTLTASTTIPYWAKDAFYASSTSVFQGLATFGNASTSQISATNSYLGTVLSGNWNGTAIGLTYGGTGISTAPSYGQILIGNSGGTYTLTATSSLGITAAIIPYIQLTSVANNVPTSTDPFLVTYDNVEEQQIFAFTPTSGHITVPESGVYVVIAGGQVGKVSGSAIRILDLWMRKNDVDIPRSSVRNNIASSADTKVVLNNAGIRLNAGDTVEIYVAVDDIVGSTGLYTYSSAGRPSNPSIILTMYKISQ